jgi:hypothetical protein
VSEATHGVEVVIKTTEQLTYGNGGWLRYQSAQLPVPVFVRMELAGERFRICEMYVGGPSRRGITGELVRQIPFNRIEAWANEDGDHLRSRMNRAAPDLRRLVSHFRSDPRRSIDLPGRPAPRPDWVSRSLDAQFDNNDEPQARELPLTEHFEPQVVRIDARLPRPASGRYGDDFYRAVATVYLQLVRYVRSPAGVIADTNHAPISTTHRWIKVARAKGFLPPAEQGKAG